MRTEISSSKSTNTRTILWKYVVNSSAVVGAACGGEERRLIPASVLPTSHTSHTSYTSHTTTSPQAMPPMHKHQPHQQSTSTSYTTTSPPATSTSYATNAQTPLPTHQCTTSYATNGHWTLDIRQWTIITHTTTNPQAPATPLPTP